MSIFQLAYIAGVFFPLYIGLGGRLVYPSVVISWRVATVLVLVSGTCLTLVVKESVLRDCAAIPAVIVCR